MPCDSIRAALSVAACKTREGAYVEEVAVGFETHVASASNLGMNAAKSSAQAPHSDG